MTRERDVNAPGGGHNLRNYWVRGEGAAKIGWGTDGSFARCVSHLGSKVKDPQGLCAEYHKAATGEWPAEKGVESSMGEMVEAHGRHNQQDHDPTKGKSDLDKLKSLVGLKPGDVKVPKSEGGLTSEKIRGTKAKEPFIDRRSNGYEDDEDTTGDVGGDLPRYESPKKLSRAEKKQLGIYEQKLFNDVDLQPDELAEYRALLRRERGFSVETFAVKKSDCGPGQHQMPDGSCMDDDSPKMEAYATGVSDEPWNGVLTVEGLESGDSRLFALGSLDWNTPPLPLMYQPANVGGHNASVMVGDIRKITRHGSRIRGEGVVFGSALTGEHADGIRHMMETGGVSVDVDKVKDADVEMVYADDETGQGGDMFAKPETTIFHRGRIRGATLVAFPAFVEAKLAFTSDVLVAHGTHNQDSHGNRYGADLERPDWSYGDSFEDVKGLELPDRVSVVRIRKDDAITGYAIRHPTRGERYVKSDHLGSTPKGIVDIFEAAKMLMTDKPLNASACGCDNTDPLVASAHTITIPNLPRAEWFNEPTDVKLSGALTITDEGRVYGIVAPAGTYHRNVKQRVPRNLDFSRFHKGETIVEGGGRVVTGVITANCGHAATENYGTLNNRLEHYDNSCSVLANIRTGYTREGHIWAAGALNPGADPGQVAQALGCALSLDVQPHPDRPGVREFIAAHLVPVPGFPLARTQASVTYEDGVIVASSVPVARVATPTYVDRSPELALAFAKRVIAESVGLDPRSRKNELMREMELV